MSSESTFDGPAIPTYVIVGSCYSAFRLLLYLPATSYTVINPGWSCHDHDLWGVRNDVSDVLDDDGARVSSYKLGPTATPSFFSIRIKRNIKHS